MRTVLGAISRYMLAAAQDLQVKTDYVLGAIGCGGQIAWGFREVEAVGSRPSVDSLDTKASGATTHNRSTAPIAYFLPF